MRVSRYKGFRLSEKGSSYVLSYYKVVDPAKKIFYFMAVPVFNQNKFMSRE